MGCQTSYCGCSMYMQIFFVYSLSNSTITSGIYSAILEIPIFLQSLPKSFRGWEIHTRGKWNHYIRQSDIRKINALPEDAF